MSVQNVKVDDFKSVLVAGRYRIEERLGKGGMGTVYRVYDTFSQKMLALKLLGRRASRSHTLSILFEREYHTLAQLAHPRIIEVYDYGVDENTHTAYYTMELLDGEDLRKLSPLCWKEACVLIRDVASCLALLHSRRLLHRDISARNVRCTADRKAKLIDFGAMVSFGSPPKLMGTPPFVSPEAFHLQYLDQKADLYSLGALAFWLITGRHAYPAKELAQLPDAWRSQPEALAELAPDVPSALSDLVMALLNLDRIARPSCAAEVMERLAAIAGLEMDEQLLVSQSYLSTPTLVGRGEQLLRVREQLLRARCGQGSALIVEGPSGMGRSRLLDACVLESKLLGAIILRADASHAHSGDWSVVRAIGLQLLENMPQEASDIAGPYQSILSNIFPSLHEKALTAQSLSPQPETYSNGLLQQTDRNDISGKESSTEANRQDRTLYAGIQALETLSDEAREKHADSRKLRPRVQSALKDWLREVGKNRLIMLAIDDVHRIDEPSAAFLALLANEKEQHGLIVAVTMDVDISSSLAVTSLEVLRQSSVRIAVSPLELEDTEALLGSVFGEVPNVKLLADKLHKASRGSPRAIMTIAQHLVDKGFIRYQSGAWTLPGRIEIDDLPDNISAALKAQIAKLSENARDLAQALAFSPGQSVSEDECLLLSGINEKSGLVHIINELLTLEIVSTDGRRYALSQSAWASALTDDITEKQSTKLHMRLARMFVQRGNHACRVAKHLFGAGQDEHALDVLIDDCRANKIRIESNSQAYVGFVISLPKDWNTIYDKALSVCTRIGRPRIQSYLLQAMITRIGDKSGLQNTVPVKEAVAQLVRDSGLDIYQKLSDLTDHKQRLLKTLELAQKRFEACTETQRVLSPSEAIPELTRTVSNVIGIAASSYDYDLFDAVPSLEPFSLLYPALGIIGKSLNTTRYATCGQHELAAKGFKDILDRISRPDRAGFDDTTYKYIDLGHRFGMGLIEASFGKKSALRWAQDIEKHPLHQVNAWRIRMVYHLDLGEFTQADECKRKIEILQIQNSPAQFYEGVHQFAEVVIYGISDDLIRIKRILPGLESMAKRFTTWIPILQFARGEYQRIRGDLKSALVELDKGLALIKPGRHAVWPNIAGSRIRVLLELDRVEQAERYGEEYIRIAEQIGLEFSALAIRDPLSKIQANLGNFDKAIKHCRISIDVVKRLESEGIKPGSIYEARARVAIRMNDRKGFATYAKLCAEQYRVGSNPELTAKYERLLRAARNANLPIPEELQHRNQFDVSLPYNDDNISRVRERLARCKGRKALLLGALELIVEYTRSDWGYLYLMRDSELILAAQDTDREPPAELLTELRAFINCFIEDEEYIQTDQSEIPTRSSFLQSCISQTKVLEPILLTKKVESGFEVVAVAVMCRKGTTNSRPGYALFQAVASCLSEALEQSTDKVSSESTKEDIDWVGTKRYRTKNLLGKGGMGSVYIVYDTNTQRTVALKRALVPTNPYDCQRQLPSIPDDTQKTKHWELLLRQEYQTLQALAHPRIVEVYDFAVDDMGPYYTMELLDGEDLRKMAPLEWRKACALLRDVASALSLLHSRKLLHRDVTARNVRCTADGRAKLMDFGAMTPMGTSKDVVGTPPHMPPEIVYNQPLDQRSDLYALGALAYWLLTGRHAYPASRPNELIDLWRTRPASPSSIITEVPEALDTLIMSLMSLDPLARPSCAAEVMERLSAIASLSMDEQLMVRQAYLWTPSLVGRDHALLRIRKQMIRSLRSRGGAVLVKGASGTGRSRFLDACVLEGKLAGLVVLRADASDAQAGDYSVTRVLVRQLIREIPDIVHRSAQPHLSVLQHVITELAIDSDSISLEATKEGTERSKEGKSAQHLRPRIQAALRGWFSDVARFRPLVVAVDDLHQIDEPSAAFIALLADQTSENRLVVVATSESDASGTSPRAISLLAQASVPIDLDNLEQEQTEQLFISVFGDAPNVLLLADRLHSISGGNPKTLMQLAQHLLDKERVIYQAGAWTLPSQIDADDLPHTLSEARKMRIRTLDSNAREIAQCIALCSKKSFSYRDCLELTADRNTVQLNQNLNELVVAEIFSTNGERYSLSHESWRRLLEEDVKPEQAKAYHHRIAALLEKNGTEQFRVTQHLLKGGEEERALKIFVAYAKETRNRIQSNTADLLAEFRSFPEDWVETFEFSLAICKKFKRPKIEYFRIQALLIGYAAVTAEPVQSHIKESAAQLHSDTGLDIYHALGGYLDPAVRLTRALELAQQRFEDTEETERTLAPADAIPQLALTILRAFGSVFGANDYSFFESLPSLEPFYPLSPMLEVVEKTSRARCHFEAGRLMQVRNDWLEVIHRMEQPDQAGLEGSNYTYLRLAIVFAIGNVEILLGLSSALARADEIEKDPLFDVNAWRIRMLVAAQQGDCKGFDYCRKQVELRYIQHSPTQLLEGSHTLAELTVYVASDDLVRVKQLLPSIEHMAERYPGWQPNKFLAYGEYQRLRGDHASALIEFERALKHIAPGRHTSWALVVSGQLSALLSLGRAGEAKEVALEALASAEREQLGFSALSCIRRPLALVQAALNDYESAVENAQSVIDAFEALNITGINLGNAYETRARVAIAMQNHEDFNAYATRCAELFRVGEDPVLTAKYQRLIQAASKAGLPVSEGKPELNIDRAAPSGSASNVPVNDIVASCHDQQQRGEKVLELLIEHCNAKGGLLFGTQENGLVCLSKRIDESSEELESELSKLAELYLEAEIEESTVVALTAADHTAAYNAVPNASLTLRNGKQFEPLLLFSEYEGETKQVVVGLAALVPRDDKLRKPSRELVTAIGNALLDTGDVVSMYAAA